MRLIELRGSPYEMGHQHGAALRLELSAVMERFHRALAGPWRERFPAERVEAEVAAMRGFLERRMPNLLPEMEGIAAGAGVSAEDIVFLHCQPAILFAPQGCSNLIVLDGPGAPAIANTLDLPVGEGNPTVLKICHPAGEPAYIGGAWIGTVWAGGCVSATGLAIGGSSCSSTDPPPEDALPANFLDRLILQKCETVKDTIRLMETLTINKGGNHALADTRGEAAIVEKSCTQQRVRRPERGALHCANYFEHPDMAPLTGVPPAMVENSRRRSANMQALLARTGGQPALDDLKWLLGATIPEGGLRQVEDDVQYRTISTHLLLPGESAIEVAERWPAEMEFQRVRL